MVFNRKILSYIAILVSLNDAFVREMPKIARNLLFLQEDCGEPCDTSDKFIKKPGKYFDHIQKYFECDFLLTSSSLTPELVKEEQLTKYADKVFVPPTLEVLPQNIKDMFTYGGKVPIYSNYFREDGQWIDKPKRLMTWPKEYVEDLIVANEKKLLRGAYGVETTNNMTDIMETYMLESIQGKHVLVIGSQSPWIEAILLHLGADKITTLEYAPINSEHPRINPITPDELRNMITKGEIPQYDAMVTFSSIEHSGLGRYGDPLNPWGDLITMAQAWCLMKPGARALVGVPSGKDAVSINSNRCYGRWMYSHLFANFDQIYSTYRDFPEKAFNEMDNVAEYCHSDDENPLWCFQPMTVIEKPAI